MNSWSYSTWPREQCSFILGRYHAWYKYTALHTEVVMEEGGSEERQVLKLLDGDLLLHQLPLGVHREELKDELVRVGEEVVVLVDLPRLPRQL